LFDENAILRTKDDGVGTSNGDDNEGEPEATSSTGEPESLTACGGVRLSFVVQRRAAPANQSPSASAMSPRRQCAQWWWRVRWPATLPQRPSLKDLTFEIGCWI